MNCQPACTPVLPSTPTVLGSRMYTLHGIGLCTLHIQGLSLPCQNCVISHSWHEACRWSHCSMSSYTCSAECSKYRLSLYVFVLTLKISPGLLVSPYQPEASLQLIVTCSAAYIV
eukprot:scpid99098/ scgid24140/ 